VVGNGVYPAYPQADAGLREPEITDPLQRPGIEQDPPIVSHGAEIGYCARAALTSTLAPAQPPTATPDSAAASTARPAAPTRVMDLPRVPVRVEL